MTDTFTWKHTTATTGSGEFDVSTAKFGDGYEQNVPNGINNERSKWTVSVQGTEAEMRACLAFVRGKKGAVSFYWTPPLYDTALFKCVRWTPSKDGLVWMLSLEFEQTGVVP